MISTDGSLGIAKKDSAQHGFTLLEIMMVLAVLSIVFVGLFGVFRTALIASEKNGKVFRFPAKCAVWSRNSFQTTWNPSTLCL